MNPIKCAVLDESGDPFECDFLTWAKWFQPGGQRIIKQEKVNGYFVSTVFVGCQIFFETIIFDSNNQPVFCRRTDTRMEAIYTHHAAKDAAQTEEFD